MKELEFLMNLCEHLSLSEKIIDRIITTYRNYHKSRSKNAAKTRSKNIDNLINEYKAILGVQENTSDKEIKSAYRRLVKLYHPDRFMNAPSAQQKLAHDQFIRIHDAYEKLLAYQNEKASQNN